MSDEQSKGDKDATNESYNLQDMLHKLQERPEDKGELVTRADGSVAYRVRKRKRRSEQPRREAAKKQRKVRLIQLAVAFFCFVLLGLSIAGMLFYVNSSTFRDDILANIRKTTGANPEMIQFSVQPNKAVAREMNLKWPDGNHLHKLDLKFIEAAIDLSSIVKLRLGGPDVTAKSGKLLMKLGTPDQPRGYEENTSSKPFNFKNYRCQNTRIEMLASDGKIWSSADEVESSIAVTPSGTQLRLQSGQLSLGGFGQFAIERAQIVFEKGLAKFNRFGLRASKTNTGLLIFSGDADLYSSEPLTFDVTLEQFPMNMLMAHGLSSYCKGNVDTTKDSLNRFIRFQIGNQSSFEVKTSFSGSQTTPFSLIMFPFLHTLSRELANQELVNGYEFDDKCEGVMQRNENSTVLSNLDFADEGKLALRGTISSDGKKLEGDLFVGLGVDFLNDNRTSPNLRKLFLTEDNGYFWTSIKISGTPAAPVDDLDEKIKAIRATNTPSNSIRIPTPMPTPEGELGP